VLNIKCTEEEEAEPVVRLLVRRDSIFLCAYKT